MQNFVHWLLQSGLGMIRDPRSSIPYSKNVNISYDEGVLCWKSSSLTPGVYFDVIFRRPSNEYDDMYMINRFYIG